MCEFRVPAVQHYNSVTSRQKRCHCFIHVFVTLDVQQNLRNSEVYLHFSAANALEEMLRTKEVNLKARNYTSAFSIFVVLFFCTLF